MNDLVTLQRTRAELAARGEDTTFIDQQISLLTNSSPRVERAVQTGAVSRRG